MPTLSFKLAGCGRSERYLKTGACLLWRGRMLRLSTASAYIMGSTPRVLRDWRLGDRRLRHGKLEPAIGCF